MRNAALIAFLLFLPLPLMADLVDAVITAIEGYEYLTSADYSHSSPVADDAARYGLPAHWQVYWLDEPVFKTRIFLAVAGKPGAPVLLLVHGLGQNGLRDWIGILPALEEQYRVLLIDLPGFGKSPPPKAKLSPTRYAELLHFVKPYFSAEPVAVVGHSMGGAVALRYAHSYPEDVSQIVLLDVAGVLQRTAFIKHSAVDRMPADQQVIPGALLNNVIGLQELGNEIIENLVKLPDPTAWLGDNDFAWGAAFGNYPNVNAALGLINEDFSSAIYEQQKPVSILWGTADLVAPLRTGRVLAENLENGRLDVIPGAGHVPMESNPQEVSAWMLHSLQTVPEPKPSRPAEISEAQTDYQCHGQFGGMVSGDYSQIVIENCNGLILDTVTARNIIIRNSAIEIEATDILESGVALEIDHSTVVMTAGTVHGLIEVNGSRLDFAGVELLQDVPFIVGDESRLVISVSRAGSQRYLHLDRTLTGTRF